MTSLARFGRYQIVLVKSGHQSSSPLSVLRSMVVRYKTYRTITRQRKQLAQLPDYLLKDIGVTRSDAMQEADKPFWK